MNAGSSRDLAADDLELARMLHSGHPDGPRELVERYQGEVFGLCCRLLRHRHDAEDAAQESMVRAIRSFSRFDAGRPILPWLLTIAANRCRTILKRRTRIIFGGDAVADPPDHRDRGGADDDALCELEPAIAKLRENYRTVFILFHEQGLSYERIAAIIDRPAGTVKTWLHRARAELADRLARRGIGRP